MTTPTQMPEMSPKPYPDRILDDIGSGFIVGAVGGSAVHFIKGLKNSPRGGRLVGAAQAVRINAPRIGGAFAVFGGLFSACDCAAVFLRNKEDPWNPIIAGATSGAFLSLRQGLIPASRSGFLFASVVALSQGAGIMQKRLESDLQRQKRDLPAPPPVSEASGGRSSSWFGGLFGKKEEEPKSGTGGGEANVVESFDPPPMPTFKY